jgi:hypothetical protein
MEDPFDLRIRFLRVLKKGLDASVTVCLLWASIFSNVSGLSSQRSIQDAIKFVMPHFSRCGEDLWDCVTEAISEVILSLHMRYVLYFLLTLPPGQHQSENEYLLFPRFLM